MYSALKIHYYYRKRKLKMLYTAVAYKISDPNILKYQLLLY